MSTPITADLIAQARDIRLVVADMDGTLLDEHSRVPEEFWDLARKMHERGIAFAPASGRQYASLAAVFEEVLDGMPIIAENGGLVMRDGKELASHTIDLDVIAGAIALLQANTDTRRAIVICGKDGAFTDCTDEETFLPEARKYYKKLTFIDDVANFREHVDAVIKFAVFDFELAEQTTAPLYSGFADRVSYSVTTKNWVDMTAPGAHKGVAVRDLQAAMGITSAQTAAFGDFRNDLEMLAEADFSFAMANGHPDVIAAARYLAPPNTEAGVVTVLRELLELR